MKGFIEINHNNKILINVNQIECVCQYSNEVKIYMVDDKEPFFISGESYEEVVNKIKQAIEE